MEERKPFFVAVKYVNASGVDKSLKSDDIYVVDEVRLKYWCFHPRHMNDFDNEEYKYGVIKNEEMVYLKVVRLAENDDDLGYGRISIPKRWSIGKGSEPLKSFRFVAEGEAGKTAADAYKRSHQVLREESHSEKKNHSEKRKSEHDKNKKKHKRRRKSHHRSQKSPDGKGNANAFNSSVRDDNSHEEDAFSDNNANGIKEDNLICSSEDKPSSSAANDPPVCDQCLKHRAEAEKAREETKQLQEELKKLKSESGTISKIEVMELLQANLKGTSVTEEKFLENVKYLEDDSANVEVPDGMVYCGNKIIVNKSDLYETSRAPNL